MATHRTCGLKYSLQGWQRLFRPLLDVVWSPSATCLVFLADDHPPSAHVPYRWFSTVFRICIHDRVTIAYAAYWTIARIATNSPANSRFQYFAVYIQGHRRNGDRAGRWTTPHIVVLDLLSFILGFGKKYTIVHCITFSQPANVSWNVFDWHLRQPPTGWLKCESGTFLLPVWEVRGNVGGRVWAHSIARPWVPISSPSTHTVWSSSYRFELFSCWLQKRFRPLARTTRIRWQVPL